MLIVSGLLIALVLLSALWVVTLRNLFRAALSLGLTLLGVAGLFLVLEAEFLAFVQILVYVGAILTLIVFAIMLTSAQRPARSMNPGEPVGPLSSRGASRQVVPAAVVSAGLFAILASSTNALVWPTSPAAEAVSLPALGQQLVTTLVLPFEVVSLIFVVAMVGAIVLASSRSPSTPGR